MRDELLTLEEVAVELGCSLSTVKRRRRAGAWRVFKDGRIVRVRRAELNRYVLVRQERATSRTASTQPAGVELRRGERLTD